MDRMTRLLLSTALLLASFATSHAELRPAAIFTDHAVLQRDRPIAVWGTASAGKLITATLGVVHTTATAGSDGKWHLMLPAQPAGGPFVLHLAGDGSVDLQDVLIGEVWLASGQSNMEFQLSRASNADAAIAAATSNQIRMFTVHAAKTKDLLHPQSDLLGAWQPSTPEAARNFSAVAYFFALHLADKLHVPVGIINSSVGGTPIEAWTSEAAMLSEPSLAAFLRSDTEKLNALQNAEQKYTDDRAAWEKQHDIKDPRDMVTPYAAVNADVSSWKSVALPAKPADLGLESGAVVWFRKDVTLDSVLVGKTVSVRFGRIAEDSELYVNGKKVGYYITPQHPPSSDVVFSVPATEWRDGPNTIALRVFSHTLRAASFGNAKVFLAGGETQILEGPWLYKITYTAPRISAADERTLPMYAAVNPQKSATVLYNEFIAPLGDYTIRGALWYQGEANTGNTARYRIIEPMMIADWRKQWQDDFPFYIVQLPNFGLKTNGMGKGHLAQMRSVQADVATTVPNSGFVTTIDVGDPDNIHPTNKQVVGDRLALLALAKTYGEKNIEFTGPTPEKITVEKGSIRIKFAHADGGLATKNGPLGGFWIAGNDRVFVPATAAIKGDSVTISAATVGSPVAVRYAWVDDPEDANLFNASNLPAPPFRTDDWPLE